MLDVLDALDWLRWRGLPWEQLYERLAEDRHDPVAWRVLDARVGKWARSELWRRGPSAGDVVTNEALMQVFVRFELARGPTTFHGFVIAQFRGALRDFIRRIGDDPEPMPMHPPTWPIPSAAEDPDVQRVRRCVEGLPERDREILSLYAGRLSRPEMATYLEVKPNTVSKQLRRALDALKSAYEQAKRDEEEAQRGGRGEQAGQVE